VRRIITDRKYSIGRTTATTTTAAATARISDVDTDPAAIELGVVHPIDSFMGFRLSAISYETKTTRAMRLAVTHHDRLFDKKKRADSKGTPKKCIPRRSGNNQFTRVDKEAYINNAAIGRKGLSTGARQ
jgi:hypothetical protein